MQTLTIEHTCWPLLHRHQTPCRHTRLTPRIPTGGPEWLALTHTVAGGERHVPDRCTHIEKHTHSNTFIAMVTQMAKWAYLCLRIIVVFSLWSVHPSTHPSNPIKGIVTPCLLSMCVIVSVYEWAWVGPRTQCWKLIQADNMQRTVLHEWHKKVHKIRTDGETQPHIKSPCCNNSLV